MISNATFKDLDKLIHSGVREIKLDSDIILSSDEESDYLNGIEINEDIVIDGSNHTLDANKKTAIFNINSKNVTLQNIIFKNAFSLEDGGAIKHNQGNLNIVNCEFIDNSSNQKGAGIFCSVNARLKISNSKFFNNYSNESPCIHNFNGNIEITGSEFLSNSSKTNASAIINQRRGRLLIKETIFESNSTENGGVILNFGKCELFESSFKYNTSSDDGGAINNQNRSLLIIKDTEFIENECGGDGGAIVNFSRANLDEVLFSKNSSKNHAGAISNQKNSTIIISNSRFIENNVGMNGGAIINWGNMDLLHCKFDKNLSKELGGAIFNQEDSSLKIISTHFIDNACDYSGGAIFNWGEINLNDLLFKNNVSSLGGAINSAKKASTFIQKSRFFENSSENGSAIFNISKNTKLLECLFANHRGNNVIYNFKSLSAFDCDFVFNSSENLVFNDEEGIISFVGGEFKNNHIQKSLIFNVGESCNLARTIFNDNFRKNEYSRNSHSKSGKDAHSRKGGEPPRNITLDSGMAEMNNDMDIHNETYLILSALEFNSTEKTILNMGVIDIKRMNPSQKISNFGRINDFSKKSSNKFDFTYLQERINGKARFKKPSLKLKNDISLELYETDFFEGGMEIKTDNLTIDGCGHTIDGANRSRIFIINAKNVVLRNIVFKNGVFRNDLDSYASGGGAINVLKDASLKVENCTFIENRSNSNGGAILNDGHLKSIDCKFINNESKTFGGAIDNKQTLKTNNDEFEGNISKIAGAIYNRNYLKIENSIVLENNQSDFIEGIYNAGLVEGSNQLDRTNLVFDSSRISKNNHDFESFAYLLDKMESFREIKLNKDIIFDFKKDFYLKYRMDIKEDLVIDGCGHTIEFNLLDKDANSLSNDDLHLFDGANSSSLFRIRREDVKVTLKNIIFKNCYSNGKDIIDNNGELVIENCKFINSRTVKEDCLINNRNSLKILNSHFSNNMTSKQSLINNSSKLEISDSNFINNNSQAMGSCIRNSGEMIIENSIFKSNDTRNNAGVIYNGFEANLKLSNDVFTDNNADVDGGVIYNYGEIEITDSKFKNNLAHDEGGVINTRTSGNIKIKNSEFIENGSKTNGGAIFNYGKVDILDSKFINNNAKLRSGAIEHTRPLDKREITYLKVSNTEFKENTATEKKDVYSYDGADIEFNDCKFD